MYDLVQWIFKKKFRQENSFNVESTKTNIFYLLYLEGKFVLKIPVPFVAYLI